MGDEDAGARDAREDDGGGSVDEDSNEERVPRVARPPREPSRQEREHHEISHLPPRDWCAHCRRGRGVKGAHQRGDATHHQYPIISIDYAYIGSSTEDDEKMYMESRRRLEKGEEAVEDDTPEGSICTLVVHDSRSGGIYGIHVDRKGVNARVQAKLLEILNMLGYRRIVLKSDQEPSVIAMRRAVQQLWEMGEITMEDSPAYDPKSNGAVERSVRTIKEQIRTMKSDLEGRLGRKLDGGDRGVLCWMIEHAGALLRRYKVGADGKTAYERVKGRASKRFMVPFGECVWWMPLRPQTAQPSNLDPRVEEGCFVGLREISDEALIMTSEGLVKCRDIRRRPEPERWSDVLIRAVSATPCDPNPGTNDMRIRTIRVDARTVPRTTASQGKSQKTRRMRLMKKDFERFGYSEGCDGCDTMRSGRMVQIRRRDGMGETTAHRPHTSACRDRIHQRLLESDEGVQRLTRDDQRVTDAMMAGPPLDEEGDEEMQAEWPQAGDKARLKDLKIRTDLNGKEVKLIEFREDKQNWKAQLEGGSCVNVREENLEEIQDEEPVHEDAFGELDTGGDKRDRAEDSDADSIAAPPGRRRRLETETGYLEVMILGVGEATGDNVDGADLEASGIGEIYSVPRVTHWCEDYNLTPGWSLDKLTLDKDNESWDFDVEEIRERARKLIKTTKPRLLIGSPMCRYFSRLMTMNWQRMDPDDARRKWNTAVSHIIFCVELYKLQLEAGRLFLHEHPHGASSWDLKVMMDLLADPRVVKVLGDQCMYGHVTEVKGVVLPVKKTTGFATNCPDIASELSLRCDRSHQHGQLLDGRAGPAARYPDRLCRAICRGLARHLARKKVEAQELDSLTLETEILNLEISEWSEIVPSDLSQKIELIKEDRAEGLYYVMARPDDEPEDEGEQEELVLPWELDEDEWQAIDDVRGGPLVVKDVVKARKTEMKYVHGRRVYRYNTKTECRRLTGKEPIKVRWVDTMKDDGLRARLVAMEFRRKHETAIFAGTPPLESLRILARIAAQGMDDEDPTCILNLDVKRAHFYAKAKRAVFVQLPPEDPMSQDPEACGELLYSMYGTRDAASNWEEEYSDFMTTIGFKKGVACPCHFYNEKMDVRILVHGDDFFCTGTENQLRELVKLVLNKYEAKYELIGPAKHLESSTKVIGRHVTFTREGLEIEVDQKYVIESLESYGLLDSNPVVSPAAKGKVESKEERSQLLLRRILGTRKDVKLGEIGQPTEEEKVEKSPELVGESATRYKSIAAKLNFVSPDRPGILFATKECMRAMACPTELDEDKLKRLLRYLKGRPREAITMPRGRQLDSKLDRIIVFVDADFAGCAKTRRSTCGGCVLWGNGMLKAWSKTITTLALSSGESELAALAKGAAEGMGIESILQDFGITVAIELHSDATAAIGIANRQGLGRIRHVAVADLWVQQRLKAGDFSVHKVNGLENISDLMTKALDAGRIDLLLKMMGVEVRGVPAVASC